MFSDKVNNMPISVNKLEGNNLNNVYRIIAEAQLKSLDGAFQFI